MSNLTKLNQIRKALRNTFNPLPIFGIVIKKNNDYFIELLNPEFPFPEFTGKSEDEVLNKLYDYILDNKYIYDVVIELVYSGCKFPIFIYGADNREIHSGNGYVWNIKGELNG